MGIDVWDVYRYCPRCGAPLAVVMNEDGRALKCTSDGYVFFQNPQAAVAAIITNPANEILLLKRNKEPQKGMWDLPGGFVNWGEEPSQAIIREIREELGVVFTPHEIICAVHDWYPFDHLRFSVNTIVYRGSITGTVYGNDEIQSLHWISPAKLPSTDISFNSVERALDILRQH